MRRVRLVKYSLSTRTRAHESRRHFHTVQKYFVAAKYNGGEKERGREKAVRAVLFKQKVQVRVFIRYDASSPYRALLFLPVSPVNKHVIRSRCAYRFAYCNVVTSALHYTDTARVSNLCRLLYLVKDISCSSFSSRFFATCPGTGGPTIIIRNARHLPNHCD